MIDLFQILQGDSLAILPSLADNSIDAIVTDPPYGLSFMGKRWDYDVPSEAIWRECLRVLKPGGHLLAFAGTRTQHRMAVRIEDAGFEIRDMIAWVYGSGFPKSLDVSKAIDNAAGAGRVPVMVPSKPGNSPRQGEGKQGVTFGDSHGGFTDISEPVTDAAKQWQGWGTALKPALEPITVARKPLKGTVAANVLAHGTGALNIDGCRVESTDKTPAPVGTFVGSKIGPVGLRGKRDGNADTLGRWPANMIHDGSEEVIAGFPETKSGELKGYVSGGTTNEHFSGKKPHEYKHSTASSGSAARFFYCAKASKRDRDEGLDMFEVKRTSVGDIRPSGDFGERLGPRADGSKRKVPEGRNTHPTVKPTNLMRYLCRLVTPPGGIVLDPFMGSGSTGKASILEGFQFIGIERDAQYIAIAKARIQAANILKAA